MKNYKKTLNLPKTKFSMRANLTQNEPKILKKWENIDIYKIIEKKNINKKKFILQDGPPYANGNIHIGHALNKVLKDIVIKSKNLSGFNTLYTPAWDCHGLPIEHKVEEKFKKQSKKISRKEFTNECKKYVLKQIKKQKKEFIRLGIFTKWNDPYLTMDIKNQGNVINQLKKIIEKKYIYSAYKPIHWCIKCKSSLAEAELNYKKKRCNTIFVLFKILETEKVKQLFKIKQKNKKNIYAPIWTTTPWSLPSNQAISLNPNIEYNLIETKKNNLIIAKKITKNVLEEFKILKYKIINNVIGKKLELTNCSHPFFKKKVPIILSNHVNLKVGTGIVHIAPDHGLEDFEASKKYNIKPLNFIKKDGCYIKGIHKLLDNISIFCSDKIIIKILEEKSKIIYKKNIIHKYPFCWRHNYPIIFISRPQWFIKLDKHGLRKKIIKEIKKVKWSPSWGRNKMIKMLSERPDWCISRQRYWGVPITIFIEKKTNKMHTNTKNFIKKIQEKIYNLDYGYWSKINQKKFLKDDNKNFFKSTDVLDVWFDSGSINVKSIYNNLKSNSQSDLYIEGSDQYRGWFMSSMIIFVATQNISPCKHIIAHGFVVDKHGKKMSKSKGNVISPDKIIKKFGADILRLWVSSTDYSKEIVMSEDVVKNIVDIYRKIRNTIRFILSNLYDFNPLEETISYKKLILIDKWIILKTHAIQQKIIKFYKNYKFHKVTNIISKFCIIELGSFYLDIVKDRLYTLPKSSLERKSCQTALFNVLKSLVIWISPILPFTSHEVWSFVENKPDSYIFTQTWHEYIKNFSEYNKDLNLLDWDKLICIKNQVNREIERSIKKKIVKSSLECNLKIYVSDEIEKEIRTLKKEIKFIFIVSKVEIKKSNKNTKTKLKIKVTKALGNKCNRCWNVFEIKETQNVKKSNICNRCIKNMTKYGETRNFV